MTPGAASRLDRVTRWSARFPVLTPVTEAAPQQHRQPFWSCWCLRPPRVRLRKVPRITYGTEGEGLGVGEPRRQGRGRRGHRESWPEGELAQCEDTR